MKTQLALADYAISEERGFLADYNPAEVQLPEQLEPVVNLAMSLPRLIPAGELRSHIESLPTVDLTDFCKDSEESQLRMAMVHYAFLIQSYVWGHAEPTSSLPACLAIPMWQLSEVNGQPPILTYSHYVLDNWDKIDRNKPIALNNIYMLQPFLGGQDEAWFVLIHVAIEAAAGEILNHFPSMIEATENLDEAGLENGLQAMSGGWEKVNAIFDRMPERCDPYVYFHRVRPWIHGWKDNPALAEGVIYEGVEQANGEPQAFRGQTGSQSSIVPAMDALLKINHSQDSLRTFLDELHIYRPPSHRQFIDEVRASANLRDAIKKIDKASLNQAYNVCLEKLAQFRTRHLEYAASYINKQGKGGAGNTTEVGTGGTPFMKYLKKHRDEVNRHLL